jgi:hypothetical protein
MSAAFWRLWLTRSCVVATVATAVVAQDLSPLQTVELLHTAMTAADAATAAALLHDDYHGVSLQGPLQQRHVYLETRDKAVSDIAALHAGDWRIRFLKSSTQIDSNGMAHVWARYVFYFKGVPDHCGHESYGLLRDRGAWKIVSFADTDNALRGRGVDEVCPDE